MEKTVNKNQPQGINLGALPQKKQQKMLMQIGKIIFQRVLVRVLDELTEDEKKEFDTLIGKSPDDEKAILAFLKDKVHDLDEIVKAETERFKTETGDIMRQAQA